MMHEKSNFAAFRRELSPAELGRVRVVAKKYGAAVLYWGRQPNNKNTGWFCIEDMGAPFVRAISTALKADLVTEGLQLWD